MSDPSVKARTRLDELLVARGHFASRSRARDAVRRGAVTIGGVVAAKPAMNVAPDARIEIADPAQHYVSRAAVKLVHGLDTFGVAVAGCTALDIGASTGGFTQVLLERGAAKVWAVDVGHGQLVPALAGNPRVVAMEGVNARDLTAAHLGGERPGLLVSDVSFISLKLALPPALALAADGARGVFLVKPQFEAGRAAIGKGGLLKPGEDPAAVASGLAHWLDMQPGWRTRDLTPSPIEGGDGNREFLLFAEKTA